MRTQKKVNYEVVFQMYETWIEETYRPANDSNIFSTFSKAKAAAIKDLKRNENRFKQAISEMRKRKQAHFKV